MCRSVSWNIYVEPWSRNDRNLRRIWFVGSGRKSRGNDSEVVRGKFYARHEYFTTKVQSNSVRERLFTEEDLELEWSQFADRLNRHTNKCKR
jgi:hypothetical protein